MSFFKKFYGKRIGVLGYWLSILILGLIVLPFSTPVSTLARDNIFLRIVLEMIVLIGISSIFIRRLHDLNKSALWGLLLFIPVVDFFFGIYLSLFPGINNHNRYGIKESLVRQLFPFL